MGETNLSDGSTSDESDVASLFNKAEADVRAGMAASSSDEDDDDGARGGTGGVRLYYTGEATTAKKNGVGGGNDDAKIRRAARERKRRAARASLNSDDEDEVSFVPKSQTKKTPTGRRSGRPGAQRDVVSLLNNDSLLNSSDDEKEKEEEESPQAAAVSAARGAAAALDAETSRRLRELRSSKRTDNQMASGSAASSLARQQQRQSLPVDVDGDDDDMQTTRQRWITVNIEGTNDSATFTMQETDSIKDVITKCVEQFKMEGDTPMGLYHENRLLHQLDLLFDVPERSTLLAKVYRKMHTGGGIIKEAPKGTMMRLTLRGPNGEKEVRIGSLQPLQVALDQYGAGKGLRFDGDKLQLDRPPGAYDIEDEDLIDVV